MGNATVRRRHSAFAAGLAALAMALGFGAIPADAAPARIDYVALGDSYTAGTGAGAFEANYPCTQTQGGYVDLVAKTGRVNLVENAACHGAVLTASSPYYDNSITITTAQEQIAALEESGALSRGTELVSITAGGNDVGVSGVLITCLTQLPQSCLLKVEDSAASFPVVYQNLVDTLRQIDDAAPNATIAVFGYPRLFDTTKPFLGVDPEVLAAINASVDALNATIEAAVEASGTNAVFIDVTDRFIGHEVNSDDPWIFFAAPTVTSEGAIVFDPRNFHPTPEGHRAYASALLSSVKLGQLVRR